MHVAPLLALAALAGLPPTAPRPADPLRAAGDERPLLLVGGRVRVAPDELVDALLVRDGRVAVAGTEAEVRAACAGEDARELDLGGATAVPGLQDAHAHLASYGATLEQADLTLATGFEQVLDRVAARAAEQPPGTWVLARGFDDTLWLTAERPHRGPLSERVPDHPVLLRRVDGHLALANDRALALAGLDGELPPDVDPEGGRVERGADGRATGVLLDTAIELVGRHVPEPGREDRRRRLLAAQDALLALGLVGVHDMGVAPEDLAVLRELEDEGRWRLRVCAYVWGNDGLEGEHAEAAAAAARARAGRVHVHGAKLMADGALGSRGAALLDDYADAPGERGLLRMAPEALRELVERCAELGLQPATHAIGDRGNRVALDAYEAALEAHPGLAALRPRVEHAQVVAPEDLSRFAALGVVPSVQPRHATTDMRWAERRLGEARLAGAYAWRALASERSPLAFGSDAPVEPPDPLLGLYAARTRQDPDGRPPGGWRPAHRLAGAEALAGFTTGAAYAVGEEAERGTLRPGAVADVTVLSVDPVTCAPEALLEARCVGTLVGGEPVHGWR